MSREQRGQMRGSLIGGMGRMLLLVPNATRGSWYCVRIGVRIGVVVYRVLLYLVSVHPVVTASN
jgi:hypothetical protein